jgi:hypothetical protein
MNNNIELLKCKVALFKMLDRFGWQTEYKGEQCLSTLCESAGEWAFNALGLSGVKQNTSLATEPILEAI